MKNQRNVRVNDNGGAKLFLKKVALIIIAFFMLVSFVGWRLDVVAAPLDNPFQETEPAASESTVEIAPNLTDPD